MAEASAKKPCFDFSRGKCKYGNRCKFTHDSKPTSKARHREPCPFLRTSKGCFKGQQCKFSHEAVAGKNGANIQPPQSTARSRPQTELQTDFREWTLLIPRQNTRFQVVAIGKFFKLGWELISKEDTETGQQIIKKLASEEGLAMIKALADQKVDGVELETRLRIFKDSTLPFFQIISHPDILSSLILEAPLDTICTFLFGPNGRRAINLFKSTTSAIGAFASAGATKDEDLTSIAVTASSAVLEKIVELNQSAQVVPEFTSIVNDLLNSIPEELLHAGSRSLARVRQRLGLGDAIPLSKGRPVNPKSHRPVFEVGQDLPGALSEVGPRHDNDHANIFDIKILPTTEEIQSSRLEYLPSSDPTKHHLPGQAGLLDRQFRLLREDTVGQVRDAVQIECRRLNKPPNTHPPPKRQNNGIRNVVYENVTLLRHEFDRKKGLQVVAEFDQPSALAKKGAKEREEWWKDSKQLQIDAFVCLVSSTGRAIFFSICDPTPTPPPRQKYGDEGREVRSTGQWRGSNERPNLFRNAKRAALMLSLVENIPEEIIWINSHLGKAHSGQRQSLVEFPGVLLPSFQPTLQALQKMSRSLDLPFSQFIAPDIQYAGDVDMHAPAYSRKPGFTFNLETLTGGAPLRFAPGKPFDGTTLREKSSLDDAQRLSTLNALGSGLALIQGPPGTGKSYTGVAIIKTLLKNRVVAKLGPIICVCYTNHALDQLLEHLVKDGVEQLIRLGSRSKSEVLQDLNLHHISKELKATKTEGYEKYLLYDKLDIVLDEIEELMPGLRDQGSWRNVKEYLEDHQNDHFNQLFGHGVDEDGFREVRGKKFSILNSWVKGAPKRVVTTRPVPELLNANLNGMSSLERTALHRYWVQQSTVELNRRFLHLLDSYSDITVSLKKCHQELDLRCLLRAHIIGVTTTGLARNLEILRRVGAKVVVVEEAGEILEAHTLTALLPSVEHAILIGDHEQLRPQINNYEFQYDNPRGAKFSLDISLFERLVHPQSGFLKLPYSSLEVQRRMHPSIAELVRSTLYPKLQDHESVFDHPEVCGMRKRLFWLDHDEKEDGSPSDPAQSFSKTNAWEVEMTAALVSHLVRQGVYRNEDIAVLTPYLGQLQKLKQRLRSSFALVVGDRDLEELQTKGLEDDSGEENMENEGNIQKTTLLNAVRIASVDNFQGEEAKVIVISLVRSNDERRCGFLKTSNRINVLLSRARHGMYIIGNTNTARSVPMWDKVITILEKGGNVGQNLQLCCPRHEETPIEVSKPDDFSIFSPEVAGMPVPINAIPNPYIMPFGACGAAKGSKRGVITPVQRFVETLAIPNVKSWSGILPYRVGTFRNQWHATWHKIQKMSNVRSRSQLFCRAASTQSRFVVMSFHLHLTIRARLSAAPLSGVATIVNKLAKTAILKIKMAVSRKLITVSARLHVVEGTPPAAMHVQMPATGISHVDSAQSRARFVVVTLDAARSATSPVCLASKTAPGPVHIRARANCHAQFPCPSVCGEICPETRYCQKCADKSVKGMMVDYIMGSRYAEIDLDETPCIIPSCGHILTLESMDGHMELAKYYNISDADNSIIALKSNSVPFSTSDLKNCPMCRKPLRNINRYGRIVRRAWIDEATKKFIVWANAQFVPLASRMEQVEAKLREHATKEQSPESSRLAETRLSSALGRLSLKPMRLVGSRNEQIQVVLKTFKADARYKEIFLLRIDIRRFLKEVDEAEQPISRIHSLVEDARKHRGVDTDFTDIPSVLQVRNRLLATVLLLRCDYAILSDCVIHGGGRASGDDLGKFRLNFALNRKDCETLIQECRSRKQPGHQVEGLLYWARFVALERGQSATLSDADMTALVERARNQLYLARAICNSYPGQTSGMQAEVSEAEKMLRDATFYEPVTNLEKAAVYAAMAQSFQGTGHWYYCANGHPFTVGECGMPMQTARCPQCGAPVGGSDHQAAAGVTRAIDFEADFGRGRR
ncbi:hypothetical protein MMC31_005862 [Peltigera leucophlebia]|nr:hypothetical protein [Peltigera leucophlebia]